MSEPERARLEKVYNGYRSSGRSTERWDPDAIGNRSILAERQLGISNLLNGLTPGSRILEIGCGAGEVLAQLKQSVPRSTAVFGIDLLADRLSRADARKAGAVAQADGRSIPFRNGQFNLVAMFTVLSSVLDPMLRQELANEAIRVLAPGGAILWYDLRMPSTNRSVRPLRRRALQSLFAGCTVQVQSTTLLPPLARRLGQREEALYSRLARVPVLRTHLLGLIRRP